LRLESETKKAEAEAQKEAERLRLEAETKKPEAEARKA